MSVLVPLQSPFAPVQNHQGSTQTPMRYRHWHETIIDYMLQHPDWTQKELAAAVGKSYASVNMVMRSDMFKARLAMRREEHNERISFSIIAKTQHIAAKALTQLDEKLEDNAVSKKISARDLGEIANEALSRIGLGPKGPDIVLNTQINGAGNATVMVSSDALLRAQGRLRQNESRLVEESDRRVAEDYKQTLPLGTQLNSTEIRTVLAEARASSPLVIDAIVNETVRSPILEELMTIGDEDGAPSPAAAASGEATEGEV